MGLSALSAGESRRSLATGQQGGRERQVGTGCPQEDHPHHGKASPGQFPAGAVHSVFGRKMRSRLVRTNQEETQQSVRISRIDEQKQQKHTILFQLELAPVLTEIPHAPQIELG